jgi:hypothetical protein
MYLMQWRERVMGQSSFWRRQMAMTRPTFLKALRRGWLLRPARGEKKPAPDIVLSGCQKRGALSGGLGAAAAFDWNGGVVVADGGVVDIDA